MSRTQERVPGGVPSGGRFAGHRHGEASIDLETGGSTAVIEAGTGCSSCGRATKRRSGLCRRCDPAAKRGRDDSSGPSRSGGVAGVTTQRSDGPVLDREAPSLTVEEIGQCDFGAVPVVRRGLIVEGQTRTCKNAIRIPAGGGGPTRCHKHGGDPAMSLGRTVAKATAEAQRGECFPLAPEHWDQQEQRLEAAQGRLLQILDTDISALSAAFVRWRAHQHNTPSRFSINNQMLVLVQHLGTATDEGLEGQDAWDRAIELSSEPHLTKTKWAELGRELNDDATGVGVIWWQGSQAPDPERRDGESDEDFEKRRREEGGFRGRHGAHIQYPLSATNGDDYEVPPSPLDNRPVAYGDPAAALSTIVDHAAESGFDVELVDKQPANGAYGYWRASDRKIVVWSGAADGDPAAVAHIAAHELGHALLGHSTDEAKEDRRPDKEVAAESFAALVCAHHGIDASKNSAWYIDNWRQGAGIDMTAAGTGPLRSAVEAFDSYVTATA